MLKYCAVALINMLLFISGEWMERFNYPGLEIWKFLNLAIFTAAALYVLRKPISAALATRREAIRQELIAAQTEREQALTRVSEAEDLLSRVDEHVAAAEAVVDGVPCHGLRAQALGDESCFA